MQKSLAKNSVFYLLYNVLRIAFPFFTGIYVSRVLLPESIGTVAAAQNLTQYFVIFAFLGIPTYGLREISKTRNNPKEKNKVYSELFVINLISTVVFTCFYLAIVLSVNAYRDNLYLYLITGISIALNAFDITWLYEGLEEFKFMSVRSLVFKAVSFCFLIFFVKTEQDVLLYALVTVVGTAGNSIVNMIYAPRFACLSFKDLNLRRHMKSIMYLVVVNLAIELYSLIDITMMNFICSKDCIAFYKYGRSIESILMQIVNTFTMVLVPRISFYYKEKMFDEYYLLLSKGLKLIFLFALPMIVGLYYTSDFLMTCFYGNLYIASSHVLKILSLLLLISPIGYLLGSRVLLVANREKMMVIPVWIGAVVNVVGNTIMIPIFAEVGAAMASVLSEIIVMIVYVSFGKKYFKLVNVWESVWKIGIACSLMAIYLFVVEKLNLNSWVIIGLQIFGATVVYCLVLFLLNETIFNDYFRILKNKIRR